MNESKLDAVELRRRTPSAWTALLQSAPGMEDVVATAVSAKPLHHSQTKAANHLVQYLISLANHSDPITLVAKYSNRQEVTFYRNLANQLPQLAPKTWFTHLFADEGWVIMDDVPQHGSPEKWTAIDVEDVVYDLAQMHQTFWKQATSLEANGLYHFTEGKSYSWDDLRGEHTLLFEEGPATPISQHAIHHAGRLAPLFLQAANGLTVMRSLGGWPGVMGESHLTAVSDLLDDPVLMLDPLKNLPTTLLHGNPHSAHWHLTLFGERRLLDWGKAVIGPSILDLVSFLEQFDLLYQANNRWNVALRSEWPLTEETIIDNYLLQLSNNLPDFDARTVRQAIPAARCLHVLTNWFPYFASWATEMPNKYTWQRVNRMSNTDMSDTVFHPMIQFRPYLSTVFQRFLRAVRTL